MGNKVPETPEIKAYYQEIAAQNSLDTIECELQSLAKIQESCAQFLEPQLQVSPFTRHDKDGFAYSCDIDIDENGELVKFEFLASTDLSEINLGAVGRKSTHLFSFRAGELAAGVLFDQYTARITNLVLMFCNENGNIDVVEPDGTMFRALDLILETALKRDAELPRIA